MIPAATLHSSLLAACPASGGIAHLYD